MSKINFQPWVGEIYEGGSIFKQKILVLGDSHYCAKEEGCLGGVTRGVSQALPETHH